ncbi:hypothetical protein, partial [Sinorhizobium meliloti]
GCTSSTARASRGGTMLELVDQFIQSGIGQALIIAAITAAAGRFFTPRGKVIWAVSHQHHYRMPNLNDGGFFPVVTQQVWFQNVGRSAIQDIEIVLNWKPQHFEIWDPRKWDGEPLSDGRWVIRVPSLNAKEFFTVSMIDTVTDLPAVLNVRCLGGAATNVRMGPQRVFPMWFNVGVAVFMFIGVVATLYWLLQFVIAALSPPRLDR